MASAYVQPDGTASGTRITAARLGPGRYQLTYTPAFAASPAPIWSVGASGSLFFASEVANGPTGILLQFRRQDGTLADPDTGFFFVAMQRF